MKKNCKRRDKHHRIIQIHICCGLQKKERWLLLRQNIFGYVGAMWQVSMKMEMYIFPIARILTGRIAANVMFLAGVIS